MTSKPGVFTMPVTSTGGYLLIEGRAAAVSSRPVAPRKAGGLGLGSLFSHTPSAAAAQIAAQIRALVSAERQRQLIGAEDDASDSMSRLLEVTHDAAVQALRAEIEQASDNPTIGQWSYLLRRLISTERQFQLLGTADHNGLSAEVDEVLPQVHAVYQKVLEGLHSCDDGMGDVLGVALTRFDTNAIAVFDLPADPSDACTTYRAAVDFSGTVEDPDFEGTGSYEVSTVWPARSIMDFSSEQNGTATYGDAHYEDLCITTSGPVTPDEPWVLSGQNVNWDALLQLDKEKYDEKLALDSGMQMDATMGTGTQQASAKDPDCEAPDTFVWGPGPDVSVPDPLFGSYTFSGGMITGSRVYDDGRFDESFTAVP
jgi:hypothetical protein